jgi:putative sigma-54 modulation protein
MNLNLTGNHLDITPAIRDYVVAKLDRITRHFDHVIDVQVVMSVAKLRHKCEVNLHARGKDIHVEAVELDMYAAIDMLVTSSPQWSSTGEARAAPPRGRRQQARRRGDRDGAGAGPCRSPRGFGLRRQAYNRAERSRRRARRSAGLHLGNRNPVAKRRATIHPLPR